MIGLTSDEKAEAFIFTNVRSCRAWLWPDPRWEGWKYVRQSTAGSWGQAREIVETSAIGDWKGKPCHSENC